MKETAIKGTIYLYIASIIFIISGYIVNIFLGRILGPVDYGTYGIIISLVSLINIVQTTGITQSVSKYVSEAKVNSDSILKSGMILQTLLNIFAFILFFFFADLIANILKDSHLVEYIQITAFVFPLYGFYALFVDYYNGLHNFKKQATMNILYSISKVILLLSFSLIYKIEGVFYGLILTPIVPLITGLHIPKSKEKVFPIKKLFMYSVPLIEIAIFSNLILSIDLFFIKALLQEKALTGFYAASQNIARLIFYGLSAINLVIFPSISHAISNNMHFRTKNIITKGLRMMCIIVVPVVFIMSATSKELVDLIYGMNYSYSSHSLSILVFGMGAFTLFTGLSYMLSGANKPHLASLFSLTGLLSSILFCIILIPNYGLIGAAIATTIGSVIALIITSLYIRKQFNSYVEFKSIGKILLSSLLLYIIALQIHIPSLLLPLLYILLFLLYVLALWLLKEFTNEDIVLVTSLLPNWMVKRKK